MKLQLTVTYLIIMGILSAVTSTYAMHHAPQIFGKNLSLLRLGQNNALKKLPFSKQSKSDTNQKTCINLSAGSLGLLGAILIGAQLDDATFKDSDHKPKICKLKGTGTLLIEEMPPDQAGAREKGILTLCGFYFNPWQHIVSKEAITVRAQLITDTGLLTVGLAIYSRRSATTVFLDYLAVDPAHQKKGIGKALMEHILDYAPCKKIDISCTPASRPFYEKIGCTKTDPLHFTYAK